MKQELRRYRQAVKDAIAASWKAGIPAFQGRDGYLVALYPDGRIVKLKKLRGPRQKPETDGAADSMDSSRTERVG